MASKLHTVLQAGENKCVTSLSEFVGISSVVFSNRLFKKLHSILFWICRMTLVSQMIVLEAPLINFSIKFGRWNPAPSPLSVSPSLSVIRGHVRRVSAIWCCDVVMSWLMETSGHCVTRDTWLGCLGWPHPVTLWAFWFVIISTSRYFLSIA